jgi:hypothetical protein
VGGGGRLDDRWDEIMNAIRGSCEWCAAAIRAMHLCELTILYRVNVPVLYGVGEQSAYEKVPGFLEKAATVLIQRKLLSENQNLGVDFAAKLAGFSCVLAHEMAHHALLHEWAVNEHYTEISGMTVERRRWVLDMLEAGKLAATAGIPYELIVTHWAVAGEIVCGELLETEADQSDEQSPLRNANSVIGRHDDGPNESGVHVAEEWGAAVVGCMIRYRLRNGRDFTLRLAESVLNELPLSAGCELVEKVLMAAGQNSEAEAQANELAVATLESAFHNSDIQDCEQMLIQRGTTWSSLLVERC